MNCESFEENLSVFIDDEASESVAEAMHDHVSTCERCASLVAAQNHLSQWVARSSDPICSTLTWDAISKRLEPTSAPLAPAPVFANKESTLWHLTKSKRIKVGFALAVAVLLMTSILPLVSKRSSIPNNTLVSTIDLTAVVESFSRGADQAFASLSTEFPGATYPSTDIEDRSVFTSESLPEGVSLVSTKTVQLPPCCCPDGTCSCKPGDCDCVAAICKRPDGSQFLLVSHRDTYGVTLGGTQLVEKKLGEQSYQAGRLNDVLTASWKSDDRRVTAIGLRNEQEAEELIAKHTMIDL